MLTNIFVLLLSAGGAAHAPAATMSASAQPKEIVVIGRRISDLEAALRQCRARRCAPDQDIDAALALAEAHFEAGNYRSARLTLLSALRHNRRYAKQYPVAVADLYRASTRVARHMGEDEEAVRAARGIGESLAKGFGKDHAQALDARYEYVDALIGTKFAARDAALNSFEREAKRAGRADLAAKARLKMLWINYLRIPHGDSKRKLLQLANSTATEDKIASVGATVLLAAIHRREGDHRTADALMSRLGKVAAEDRVLLYAPGYQLYERYEDFVKGQSIDVDALYNDEVTEKTYVDVSFWITSEGAVRDAEVTRAGHTPFWIGPILESIKGRRYSASASGTETFKVERYTYTAKLVTQTGTRIKRRWPVGRIEYLDLTSADPKKNVLSPAGIQLRLI